MGDLRDELKAEYTLLQSHLESFDAKALTIKSWATPLLAGGVGFGVKEESLDFIAMVAVAAFSLWLLEAFWKSFQDCYVARINLIEAWFVDPQSEPLVPFQIYSAWRQAWQQKMKYPRSIAKRFVQPFIVLPYLPILIACIYFLLTVTPK